MNIARSLILLFSLTTLLWADSTTLESSTPISQTKYDNYLGFSTGLSLRAGISYRHWFGNEDDFAFQVHFFPFLKRQYDSYDSTYTTSGRLKVGLTHLINIRDYSVGRLVYWTNGTFSYNTDDGEYKAYVEKEETERSISVGTGPGFELHVWRFNFDFLTGVSGYYNIDAETYQIYPAAEFAAHIRF